MIILMVAAGIVLGFLALAFLDYLIIGIFFFIMAALALAGIASIFIFELYDEAILIVSLLVFGVIAKLIAIIYMEIKDSLKVEEQLPSPTPPKLKQEHTPATSKWLNENLQRV